MKSFLVKGVCAALCVLSACTSAETPDVNTSSALPPAGDAAGPAAEGVASAHPLDPILAGAWRQDTDRDRWRNPAETLDFFGISPDDTVIEIWPGRGWYTDILAPYLATGNGTLIAALWDENVYEGERRSRIESLISDFKQNYASDPDTFGILAYTRFSAQSGPLAEPGSVDAVLTFRNVHNWMAQDYENKLFQDAFAALKPGGILGVVEHRLPSSQAQDPRGASGYVHEDYVRSLATRAGFEILAASQINANPMDTADHPFGVWTLPPSRRTSDREGHTPAGFDPELYLAIGESDRMTLKFRKPVTGAAN